MTDAQREGFRRTSHFAVSRGVGRDAPVRATSERRKLALAPKMRGLRRFAGARSGAAARFSAAGFAACTAFCHFKTLERQAS